MKIIGLILKLIKSDPEVYTCVSEVYTGRYEFFYRLILKFIQSDT
jgi:hypothetical protein